MYLHLGQDYIVPLQNVVAVFDMATATVSGRTQRLLSRLQDEGRIIELYDDLPRAAVLCESALGETLAKADAACGRTRLPYPYQKPLRHSAAAQCNPVRGVNT